MEVHKKRVIDVARIILKKLNINKKIIKKPSPVGSAKRRMPDIKKLKKLVGWIPTTSLEEGIEKTINADKKK